MRTAAEVWQATQDDPRWIDDPTAMVALVLAEGFAAGIERAARTVELHAHRMPRVATGQAQGFVAAIRQAVA